MESTERLINSRYVASQILYRYLRHGMMPDRLLDDLARDRAFITEMVWGVVRNQGALDWVIKRLAKRPPGKDVIPLLWVGLYQVLLLDHVEPYAAVHETVEAAKLCCEERRAGFVNAILRRALREKETLLKKLEQQTPDIRYSHPRSLLERWNKQFGEAATIALCEWDNQRPEITLRVRPNVVRDELLDTLQHSGVPARPHRRADFIVLPAGGHIEHLPGYREGWFVVQDPATMLAVELLDPQPGESVLDACAAPGGKTIALADAMRNKGKLVASDLNPLRLKTLKTNLTRCHLPNIQQKKLDISESTPSDFKGQRFDAVLLDVPCSNTGVIRRRPDARQRITHEHLEQIVALQEQILEHALLLVAPGGRLVYSTCSLEREENEEQVAALQERHPDCILESEARSFPPTDEMDGAYAARIIYP